ncbi:hypothetical protein H257_13616 [Aphanomyces astaci]|uniref:Uncharacterized protein n=1 Tax=Aphanomyces astaci TaxID=112090 RepID=W4FV50_APHAT|nr:hypothetical protein H257_13616 [Aphanomyces astaci]ETV70826.1 hypothetical protein H257_13616 [Aphanomyces astaci]|eukprot:XP_009839489.1 hypothetical protein H257_13616 [Aphanomyces astaci]
MLFKQEAMTKDVFLGNIHSKLRRRHYQDGVFQSHRLDEIGLDLTSSDSWPYRMRCANASPKLCVYAHSGAAQATWDAKTDTLVPILKDEW